MSEEFSITASFEMNSHAQMSELQTLLEHLDLYETAEASSILAKHDIADAQQKIKLLTSPHSDYDNSSNLIDMYIATHDDNVEDVKLVINESGLVATLHAEGYDHDADDFCSAMILILIAMGAKKIDASGGSPFWFAKWKYDSLVGAQLEFNEELR